MDKDYLITNGGWLAGRPFYALSVEFAEDDSIFHREHFDGFLGYSSE